MTLASSGTISLSGSTSTRSVSLELGKGATGSVALGGYPTRNLAQDFSSTIALGDLYSKTQNIKNTGLYQGDRFLNYDYTLASTIKATWNNPANQSINPYVTIVVDSTVSNRIYFRVGCSGRHISGLARGGGSWIRNTSGTESSRLAIPNPTFQNDDASMHIKGTTDSDSGFYIEVPSGTASSYTVKRLLNNVTSSQTNASSVSSSYSMNTTYGTPIKSKTAGKGSQTTYYSTITDSAQTIHSGTSNQRAVQLEKNFKFDGATTNSGVSTSTEEFLLIFENSGNPTYYVGFDIGLHGEIVYTSSGTETLEYPTPSGIF